MIDPLREDAYRLLSACFYPPTELLSDENCLDALARTVEALSPAIAPTAREAASLFNSSGLQEQMVEYSRLFLGPFKLVAPPYGSVWLDQSKTVMGESTALVARFYQEYGLRLADDFPELPDHIAVEFEFLSLLCFREREADSMGRRQEVIQFREGRQEFMQKFMLPWIAPFAEAVAADASSGFYAAISRTAVELISADLLQLAENTDA